MSLWWWWASRDWRVGTSVELTSSTMSRRLNRDVVELESVDGEGGNEAGGGGKGERGR